MPLLSLLLTGGAVQIDDPPPGGGGGDPTTPVGYVYDSTLAAHGALPGSTAVAQARTTGGTFTQWNSASLTRLGLVPSSPSSTEATQTLAARPTSTYAVEFDFTGSTFDVEATGGWVNVWADDEQVAAPVLLSGSQAVRVTLPSAAARRIVVECGPAATLGVSSSGCTLAGIRHFSGAVSNPGVTRRRLFIIGDSWVEGASFDASDVNAPGMRHMAWLAGRYAGADVYYNGKSGSGYKANDGFLGHYGAASRIAQIVAADPHDLIVFGSINDFNNDTTRDMAAAFYAAIATELPDCNVIVVGRQSYNNATNSATPDNDYTTAIAGASNVLGYVSPRLEAWITGTGNTVSPAGNGTADVYHNGNNTQHLSDAGNLYYGRKLAQALATLIPA